MNSTGPRSIEVLERFALEVLCNVSSDGQNSRQEDTEDVFARQPKNGGPTAEERREAYRRMLFEVLGSAKEDWTVRVEDGLAGANEQSDAAERLQGMPTTRIDGLRPAYLQPQPSD